jgi:hemerythrin
VLAVNEEKRDNVIEGAASNNSQQRGGKDMPLITWNEQFAVNIKEVDDQHKRLIDLLNLLFDAMKMGKGKEALSLVLDELAQYTVYHFGTEERLFREYGYPEADIHKAEHDAFTKKVIDFQGSFNKGQTLITIDLLNFLTDWLKNHITKVDKRFGPFLTGKGAT